MAVINNSGLGLPAPKNTLYSKKSSLGSTFVPKGSSLWGNTSDYVPNNNLVQNTPVKNSTSQPRVVNPDVNYGTTPPATTTPPSPLASSFQGMKDALGSAPTIQYEGAAPKVGALFASQKPIQGLGSNYFNSVRTQMKDNLQREFFGPLGTAQNTASSEGAAGRLDSGVGKRVLEETVSRPFAEGLVDIDSQILQKQMEENARVEGANQEQNNARQQILATIYASDSANQLEATKANMTLATKFSEIASDMAKYERGEISEQDMFNKKMEFDSIVAEVQNANNEREWSWARSQDALSLNTWLPDTVQGWKNSGLTYEQALDKLKPMMATGGGVQYQAMIQTLQDTYGVPVQSNPKQFA